MLWIKAFHIVAIVAWFAGLFYLPRLFVYHALCEDETGRERFKVMERKLYRGIMTPSAVVAAALGIWLILLNPSYYLQAGWLHTKLALVLLLLVYHGFCWHYLRRFRDDRNTKTHVFYRWFNEVPTLLLVAIVILAVVKPY